MTDAVRYRPPGDHGSRYSHRVVLAAFWSAIGLVCVAAVVVGLLRETDAAVSKCPPGKICLTPPRVLPKGRLHTWTSRARGVSLQYPVPAFSVDTQSDSTLRLSLNGARPSGVEATLWITLQPGRDALPDDALRQRRDDLSASILGLTEDQDPQTSIPRPSIGDVAGVGGSYRGTTDSPQGPVDPAIAILVAATNGRTTAVVSYVITGTDDTLEIRSLRSFLSVVLSSVRWTP